MKKLSVLGLLCTFLINYLQSKGAWAERSFFLASNEYFIRKRRESNIQCVGMEDEGDVCDVGGVDGAQCSNF